MLQKAGYQTSLLGKYLNGYGDPKMTKKTAPIPCGWNDWHVSNNTGYQEFNYYQNDNGKVDYYRKEVGTYGVDVANRLAQKFIKKNAHHPFLVEDNLCSPLAVHACCGNAKRLRP